MSQQMRHRAGYAAVSSSDSHEPSESPQRGTGERLGYEMRCLTLCSCWCRLSGMQG
jgi:hypothetical protein